MLKSISELSLVFLTPDLIKPPDFKFSTIYKSTKETVTNMLIIGDNVDTHTEMMNLRKIC